MYMTEILVAMLGMFAFIIHIRLSNLRDYVDRLECEMKILRSGNKIRELENKIREIEWNYLNN